MDPVCQLMGRVSDLWRSRTTISFRKGMVRLLIVAVVAIRPGQFVSANGQLAAGERQPNGDFSESRARELIEQLGAPVYQVREQADAELREMGLEVFELLHQAERHPDLEVKLRAQAMLHDLRGKYVLRNLAPALRQLLAGYEDRDSSERLFLLGRIAILVPQDGVDALTRLARFEREEIISKFAAIGLLGCKLPTSDARKQQVGQLIRHNLGTGERPAIDWLRLFSDSLIDPRNVGTGWAKAIQRERELGTDERGGDTPSDFARRLNTAYAAALIAADRTNEAASVIRTISAEISGDQEQRRMWLLWLVDHRQWGSLDEFIRRIEPTLPSDPRSLYAIAEAEVAQGRSEQADARVKLALEASPSLAQRIDVAEWLYNSRGQYAWAEVEYRRALGEPETDPEAYLNAAISLTAMLHDLERDDEAAQLLEELASLSEKSEVVGKAVAQRPDLINRNPLLIHLYRAENCRRKKQHDQLVEHLQRAFEASPADIEVLIAMYRAPQATPEWQNLTRAAIRKTAQEFDLNIRRHLAEIEATSVDESLRSRLELAQDCNEYAWLVANTEGDFDRAVAYSRLSLDHSPGTEAYMDTLGRSYFAQGDLEKAIHYQTLAAERAPHAQQIQRQLIQFLEAQKSRATSANENKDDQ